MSFDPYNGDPDIDVRVARLTRRGRVIDLGAGRPFVTIVGRIAGGRTLTDRRGRARRFKTQDAATDAGLRWLEDGDPWEAL